MSAARDEIIVIINQLMQNLASGLYLRDKKSAELLFCNDIFAQIHGYGNAEEIKGIKTWDLIEPTWRKRVLTFLHEKGHYEGAGIAYTRNKEKIHINLTILEIPKTSLILGITRDVTEETEMESKLIKSEAKYRALVDTIQEGLIIVDQNEEIVFANPAIYKSLNYSESELIGQNLSDITTSDQFQIIQQETENRKSGISNQFEVQLLTKTEILKTFLVSAAPLIDSNANYAGAIAVCMDIGYRHLTKLDDVDLPSIFLDLLLVELSDQLLRARGWLDILESQSKMGDKERIGNIQNSLSKIDILSKQVKEVFSVSSDPMKVQITLSDLLNRVNERVINIIAPKSIELFFEPFSQDLR
ncbi:MAG: PAS domain-containing protein [Candidatus Hodarchaeales archaeon]|jgi:PAS domain S-box-containing protein